MNSMILIRDGGCSRKHYRDTVKIVILKNNVLATISKLHELRLERIK